MPVFTVGLDLGQANDYSALAIVEHVMVLPPDYPRAGYGAEPHPERIPAATKPEHRVRFLKRWPLGTSYPQVVDETAAILHDDQMRYHSHFSFDATGVGRAVKDLFWEKYQAAEMNQTIYRAVTITAQIKRNMADAVLVPIQQGRLKIPTGLLLGAALERELVSFRQKISASGNTSYDTTDKDGHGDIATALMLAMLNAKRLYGHRLVDASNELNHHPVD